MRAVALGLCMLSQVSAVHTPPGRYLRLPSDPPVNEGNALAEQHASLHNDLDCKGNSTTLDSSANAFHGDFEPYIKNLKSVKLCGKGTFFYFDTPDMQMLATLGHVTRCGDHFSKSLDSCECANLPRDTWKIVQSMSLQ